MGSRCGLSAGAFSKKPLRANKDENSYSLAILSPSEPIKGQSMHLVLGTEQIKGAFPVLPGNVR